MAGDNSGTSRITTRIKMSETPETKKEASDFAIGVFDSGIGGLSVLRHIRSRLPSENIIYFADTAFAPYGDKNEEDVINRVFAVADFLLRRKCKALVVACNTATAVAIHLLREKYPDYPIIGVEPGLKPASLCSQTHKIGVLATERTLNSKKFHALRDQLTRDANAIFFTQACNGLADRIEKGESDAPETKTLIKKYLAPLAKEKIDTLVLGCTHYPFAQTQIEQIAKELGMDELNIIDTGEAIARQLDKQLAKYERQNLTRNQSTLIAYTTGKQETLTKAFAKLLRLTPTVTKIAV